MLDTIKFKFKMVHLLNLVTLKFTKFGYVNHANLTMDRLGTEYGGWWIPSSALIASETKVLVSIGLGYDVSFDSEAVKRGFRVIGLDQQIDSVTYANNIINSASATFICKGLGINTGMVRFYAPQNLLHDSWSITNAQNTNIENSRLFEVISFEDLCRDYPEILSSQFSMLKMDIEGAELPILKSISHALDFHYLGVEMDCLSLIPFLDIKSRILRIIEVRNLLNILKSCGYRLVHSENFNFFLMKKEYLEKLQNTQKNDLTPGSTHSLYLLF